MKVSRHISIQNGIRFGKPIITGTRISVEDVVNWISSGMTLDEIITDFPELNKEQICMFGVQT